MCPRRCCLVALALFSGTLLAVDDPELTSGGKKKDDRTPAGINPNEPPQEAMKKFSVAPGLQVDLWAAEPLVANVVAFSFDHLGRAFVSETYRRRTSCPDIRKNMDWLLPSLAMRTVADREAFLKKTLDPALHLKPTEAHLDNNNDGQFDWHDWEVESERIKLVEDKTGSGVANASSVFADGFSTLVTGTAAGVLAYGDSVWWTCIPDVWRFEGASGEKASSKTNLQTGFGVHIAYGGHDMHGIKMGPDGRVYWTIADCGAHVTTKEGKTIDMPDAGAVYRMKPDGTEMELFAYGLRNPQSLAFNDLGDLFTGDNNADGGDKARWEHIVEGGDYGWRIGWQFLPKLGAWNSEKLWEMDIGSTALSLLPPTGLLGHGPAGVAYYPGTGLPEAYRDHFFMADFPGGVRAFHLKPQGASYRVDLSPELQLNNSPGESQGKLLWGLFPSDVQFGVDGGVYVLDWVRGWDKTGQGRIFRVHDPVTDKSEATQQTKTLLAEGMTARTPYELLTLLRNPDQRVRMAAQFELVGRGKECLPELELGTKTGDTIARLHALWGLGQLGRTVPEAYAAVSARLHDDDPEVRGQAAKVLGEIRPVAHEIFSSQGAWAPRLLPLLEDPSPRVRFFAAQALGKLGAESSVGPLVALLRDRTDGDAYIRHAAVVALTRCVREDELTKLIHDPSDSVRIGVLLALRRLHSPEVAAFLKDANPQLVLEAARAIHDEPIEAALPQLAAWAGSPDLPAPLSRRAINAAYRLGTAGGASDLASLAYNQAAPEAARIDAIQALGQWGNDLGRDRVLGVYRPFAPRPILHGAEYFGLYQLALLQDPLDSIRIAAAEAAAAQNNVVTAGPILLSMTQNEKLSAPVRLAALRALGELKYEGLPQAIAATLHAGDPALTKEARRLSAATSPNDAFSQAATALDDGTPAEKQSAFQVLATSKDHEADKLIAKWLDRLTAGKVPAEAQLELLEAAAQKSDKRVVEKLANFEKSRPTEDPLGPWRECLEGGDAELGRKVFAEKAEAACMRCHKYKGEGGDVGPDLFGIGSRHDRKYILTSIVLPNADIAPGYENVLLTLKDGNVVIGIKSAETADELSIQPLTGGPKVQVRKELIARRDAVPSPMPEGLGLVLGKRDVRNVVEFLATGK